MEEVSRQRKWQLKQQAKGLCQKCGLKHSIYCGKHAAKRMIEDNPPWLREYIAKEVAAGKREILEKLRDKWSYFGTAGGSGTAQAVHVKEFDKMLAELTPSKDLVIKPGETKNGIKNNGTTDVILTKTIISKNMGPKEETVRILFKSEERPKV